jgi:3-deoxy-7-phosphoheptulonate synthase
MSVDVDTETDWRLLEADQAVPYENPADDPDQTGKVLAKIREHGGLVEQSECEALTEALGDVYRGKAFVASGGNCADTLDTRDSVYQNLIRVMLQMVMILMYRTGLPVVKLLRVGNFAKPRSEAMEIVKDEGEINSYRGDIANGLKPTAEARRFNPARMWLCYKATKTTMDSIRRFTRGGRASMERIREWNLDYVSGTVQGRAYAKIIAGIEHFLTVMRAAGFNTDDLPQLHEAQTFFAHEGLVLPYEDALVFDDWSLSAHLLWIGERTRGLKKAHVAFFRKLKNSVGVKIGPTTTVEEIVQYCAILNPDNVPGKLVFIARMGANDIHLLAALMRAAALTGCPVVWICDPMHGNTIKAKGFKTRRLSAIKAEIRGFFAAVSQLRAEGFDIYPGGVMLEMVGENVKECLGGHEAITASQLKDGYATACDPRLNARQSLELIFLIARLLKEFHEAVAAEELQAA